jgi:hypothetical protein
MYLRCKNCHFLHVGYKRENIEIGIENMKKYIKTLKLNIYDINIFGKMFVIEDFEKCYKCGNIYTNMYIDTKNINDYHPEPIINFFIELLK